MLHYLRIAVTMLSLTACVLLIALWVRSSQWRDELFGLPFGQGTLAIVSIKGKLELHTFPATKNDIFGDRHDSLDNEPFGFIDNLPTTIGPSGVSPPPSISIPHWCALIVIGATGSVLWMPWRFSLRTLLIATTLVAVVLGLVVAFSR